MSAFPRLTPLLLLGVLLAATSLSQAKTITITATFTYTDPSGVSKPCRWCWCELIDYDPVNDDVLTDGYTNENGVVSLQYDSETGDGWGGGRVDPYVRCYTRLELPKTRGGRWETGWVVKKRRFSITQLQRAYHELNTNRYDNNNADRNTSATATGETARAFFLTDCLAHANALRPAAGLTQQAPMALHGEVCALKAQVVYPAALDTKYSVPSDELLINDDRDSFDDVIHEYGHHEMAKVYGGAFGDYDCTQDKHSFNAVLSDSWISADARWTAFCEAWADFCPIITRREPTYHGFNLEAPDLEHGSDRCEGTVCRVFWDLSDTHADKTAVVGTNNEYQPADRTPVGGVVMDDDPFGFAPGSPALGSVNLYQMKGVIQGHHPKSLTGFRDACRADWGSGNITARALDAVLWINGFREGISNNAPMCTLTVSGPSQDAVVSGVNRTYYTSDMTLRAAVSDADALDQALHHVTFYWVYLSQSGGHLYDRDQWHAIGADVNYDDGFECTWPVSAWPTNRALPVYLIAVASDFFGESAWQANPAMFTSAQKGPVYLGAPPGGTGGTGGTVGGGTAQELANSGYRAQGTSSIVGWDWLRNSGATATWQFETDQLPLAEAGHVRLVFDGLITNQTTGGAGYSSVLNLVLRVPGGETASVTIATTNPYKPINPNLRNGTGYSVNGISTPLPLAFAQKAIREGHLTAVLTWPSGVDNRYHAAVKGSSLKLKVIK